MGELKIGRESQRQVEVSNDTSYDFQAQSSSSVWEKKKVAVHKGHHNAYSENKFYQSADSSNC